MTDGATSGDERGGRRPAAGRHRAWRLRRVRQRSPAGDAELPQVTCGFSYRVGGAPAFGEELYELLRRFQACGSFAAAAAELGVSYEAAWRALRFCERRLRLRLVRRRAGEAAPGASLTPRGRTILERYAALAQAQPAVLGGLTGRLDRRSG